jgi:hypothetical protein
MMGNLPWRSILVLILALPLTGRASTAIAAGPVLEKSLSLCDATDADLAALKAADNAYQAGDEKKAKKLYLKAAPEGSAEAHFELAYRYVWPNNEGLNHYIKAAQKGHEKALGYALDGLLFRADSLKSADPQKALDLYLLAKRTNPGLHLFDEEHVARVLQMCAEPKGFDAIAFMNKYNIKEEEVENFGYGTWELAEEASKGGRFGKPDPWLVLNLVIRGGSVPAELSYAVEDTYKNWKNGVVKEFNICDYVTSGYGEGYCAARRKKKEEAKRSAAEKRITSNWPKDHQDAFRELKGIAAAYFDARVENEVDQSGTARAALMIYEENSLEEEFHNSLKKCEGGDLPGFGLLDFKKADAILNKIYSMIMKTSDREYGTVKPAGINSVQRKWLDYREAWVRFGSVRYPRVKGDSWRSWLTQERVEQLREFTQ